MKKILVVDDEEDIRTLIRTLLESEGYNVEEAESGKSAIIKLQKNNFDLAIIDFFMPAMSGRELLEKIMQEPKFKKTKTVFLTVANLSISGQKELKNLGCLDYIKKPIDNEDFLKRIKNIFK